MGRSWLIRSEDVAGMGDHHQLGPGNLFRDELSVAWSYQAVPFAVNHQRRRRNAGQPAVGFPGKNPLQLRIVAIWMREPGPALLYVFLDQTLRRARVIDERHTSAGSLFACHGAARQQHLGPFRLATYPIGAARGGAAQNQGTDAPRGLERE